MTRPIVRRFLLSVLVSLALACSAHAGVTYGPGGSGVTVGNSGLIDTLDLSDTFTGTDDGGNPGRPYVAVPQPAPAYVLENTYGSPGRMWTGSFSFASDRNPSNPGFVDGTPPFPGNPLVNENVSGSGTITGFTQTGGAVDYGVPFGLRNKFVVQFDAVQNTDRVDITSSNNLGTIWGANTLSVFFRPPGGPYPEIGLFNGSAEMNSGLTSGIVGNTWNNYAVEFDRINNSIEVFVNEVSRGTVDLSTFGGGAYANYGVGYVNIGGAGGSRVWTDNAQIGIPEPTIGPPSLVSYLTFDESAAGTGTAFDQVHANNGAFTGTAVRAAGLVGTGAALFNHTTGDGVNVGNGQNGLNNLFSFTKGITVEALIQPGAALGSNAFEEIFRKEDGNNRILLSFQANGSILAFGINDGTGYKELDMPLDGNLGRPTLADLKDGDPHHIVATYDSDSGFKGLYVDGALRFSTTVGAGTDMISGGGGPAIIGNYTANVEPFDGLIDELAIYNAALSGRDIMTHYTNAMGGRNYFLIPEPNTFLLLAIGLAFAALGLRRRR